MIGSVGGSGDFRSAGLRRQNPNGASLQNYETLTVDEARKVQEDLKLTCKYEVKKFLSEALKNEGGRDGFLQKAGELIFLKNLMEKLKKDPSYKIYKIEYEENVDLKKTDRFFKIKSIAFTAGKETPILKKETIDKYVATFKDTLKSNLDKLCSLDANKHYDYTLGFEDSLNTKDLISGSINAKSIFLNWNRERTNFHIGKNVPFRFANLKATDYVSKTSSKSTVSSDSGTKVVVFKKTEGKRKSQINKYLKKLKTEKNELANELSQQSELESQQSELVEKNKKKMLKLMILENYLKQARDKKLDLKELHLSISEDSKSLSDVKSLVIKENGKINSYDFNTFDVDDKMYNFFKEVLATKKNKRNSNKSLDFKLNPTQYHNSRLTKISDSNFKTLLNIEELSVKKTVKRKVKSSLSKIKSLRLPTPKPVNSRGRSDSSEEAV